MVGPEFKQPEIRRKIAAQSSDSDTSPCVLGHRLRGIATGAEERTRSLTPLRPPSEAEGAHEHREAGPGGRLHDTSEAPRGLEEAELGIEELLQGEGEACGQRQRGAMHAALLPEPPCVLHRQGRHQEADADGEVGPDLRMVELTSRAVCEDGLQARRRFFRLARATPSLLSVAFRSVRMIR